MYLWDASSKSTSTSAKCGGCSLYNRRPVRSCSIQAGLSQARDGKSVKTMSKMWAASSVCIRTFDCGADGGGDVISRKLDSAGMTGTVAGEAMAVPSAIGGCKPTLTAIGGCKPTLTDEACRSVVLPPSSKVCSENVDAECKSASVFDDGVAPRAGNKPGMGDSSRR